MLLDAVLVQLPQPLDQLLQQDHDTKPNSVDVNPAQQLTSASDAASDMPATSSDGDHSSSGASSHVLPVTRSLLAQLMQRCSNTSVRQQVYLEVLQPKLEEATALLNKLARCVLQSAVYCCMHKRLAQVCGACLGQLTSCKNNRPQLLPI